MAGTSYQLLDRSGGLSRRDVLRATLLGTAAAAASSFSAPFGHADDPITLRYAGTGVNAFKELADKCEEDTGIIIQYTTLTSDYVVKRAVTRPSSFDMLDSEYWMLKKIVPSSNLRGMDTKKIKLYDEVVPIFTKGKLPDGADTTRMAWRLSRSAT
jgi:putative spermidine/putrescine transport system substrate-binding protein